MKLFVTLYILGHVAHTTPLESQINPLTGNRWTPQECAEIAGDTQDLARELVGKAPELTTYRGQRISRGDVFVLCDYAETAPKVEP